MPIETWKRNNKLAASCVRYIQRFNGKPYLWGGDDPIAGFDCSGMALEFLKKAGMVAEDFDTTANGLMVMYKNSRVAVPMIGTFVFFGKQQKATHVGICIDSRQMIEAGGGGSKTTDTDAAIAQNAYIRERPINRRNDILCFCDPFKE